MADKIKAWRVDLSPYTFTHRFVIPNRETGELDHKDRDELINPRVEIPRFLLSSQSGGADGKPPRDFHYADFMHLAIRIQECAGTHLTMTDDEFVKAGKRMQEVANHIFGIRELELMRRLTPVHDGGTAQPTDLQSAEDWPESDPKNGRRKTAK